MNKQEKIQALRELAAWCEKWEVEIDCDWSDFGNHVVQFDSTYKSKRGGYQKLIHDTTINKDVLIAEAERLELKSEQNKSTSLVDKNQ